MNITIRQIQAFLQVATLGSFTRAAEKLHTMQPALSQQVRDLEAELGIRLFDRTTRRVELTEGGAEFRNIAAKIIEELEAAARNAHDLAERKRGRVVVAAPPLLAAAVVPRAIVAFGEEYPGLNVRLIDARSDQIVELVRTGQVDCGIGTFHAGEEAIASTLLARDNLMVFCASAHPFAKRTAVGWQDLESLPLVTLTRDSSIRILVEVGYEAARIKLVPAYEVSWITTALAMVEAGLGIGVFPTYAWAGAQALNISAAPLVPAITRDITLITRAGRTIAPATSAFARFLRQATDVSTPWRNHVKRADSRTRASSNGSKRLP
ncbi:LysR family transcriptional regulator [Bradyrhizobium sp. CIR3A]|uniref:LysR family transcriptional regulator n=1 Tax=Bradyrhizobium sp. CIR3A TaxID=2663838 RepID=UPI0016068228|nr:LysR family transcriptional regulator [Bradyrhizobium sp. CIR3A]MBB4261373.1 DNA-binding transcriptional LysR family regulator [Bradyrhizobium sp. CIR3A]